MTQIVSRENDNKIDLPKREPVKSRTKEYADKWNQNMFLNDFDKRDENAGVNVKLSEVYSLITAICTQYIQSTFN